MHKKICVVGLGYIGLPTSAMFAQSGCEVLGVDVSELVVNTINHGHIHIEEPGLGEVVKEQVKKGTLRASLLPEKADAFIISVPTPNHDDEYKSCDLTYVIAGIKKILPYIEAGNTVIVESTIAPKSMDDFVKPLFEENGYVAGENIYLAHCPERVLPGQILHELKYNNRIVGGITPACTEHAAKIYKIFVEGEIIKTEAKTAELSKCMENTFRDVNIALANELARISYELDINCLDVIRMANKHPRVNIHQPGPGVGGHCLAIDPYFICSKAPETARIIRLSRDTNKSMPRFVADRVQMLVKEIENPRIAAFGVTYKGNVDDVRESPSFEIVEILKKEGYQVRVYDPHVSNPEYVDLDTAVSGADLVLVLTDHNEYKNMDHKHISSMMRTPMLFDTRNMIKEQEGSGLTIINYGNLYRYKKQTAEEKVRDSE